MTSAAITQTSVRFEKALVGAEIDAKFIAAGTSRMRNDVVLDLARVTFADTMGLAYLTACARTLQLHGHSVTLELPESEMVRAYMRRVRFGVSLGAALGVDAAELMTAPSREKYTGEPARYYLSSEQRGGASQHLYRGHTRVQEFNVLTEPTLAHAAAASEMYSADENRGGVKTFLRTHLGRHWDLVEPLMYEALANTVHHPNARRVIYVGHVDPKTHPRRHLHLSVWDDGANIISTLRDAARTRSLRDGDYSNDFAYYGVRSASHPSDAKAPSRTLYSGDQVTDADSDETLLIASGYPGVTSDPDRLRREGLTDDGQRPGMGLYLLISFAVEQLGGTVLLRAGGTMANFAAPSDADAGDSGLPGEADPKIRYNVGVVTNPEMGRFFSGNQVVVRLPIDHSA